MLIDQHRAHVRVLFDRYMSQIRQKQGVSQGVLFPEIIQLPASEAAVLDGILEDLSAVGSIESAGWRQLCHQRHTFGHRGIEPGRIGPEYGTYCYGKRE